MKINNPHFSKVKKFTNLQFFLNEFYQKRTLDYLFLHYVLKINKVCYLKTIIKLIITFGCINNEHFSNVKKLANILQKI